jgi:homoserine kinase type II
MRSPDLAAWPITSTAVSRAPDGRNNDTYFVDAAEGSYVLRVYQNTADPERVRDEHDLLGLLALHDLPFATPELVRTTSGDTLAVLESDHGPRLAALFVRIPGKEAAMITRDARLAGRALAQLDRALGQVPRAIKTPATIRDVHPLVPDPLDAIRELDLGHRYAIARELFERVDAAHDTLDASLPRQIVHGDFAFLNVLIHEGEVSGLVDFEFASSDFRAADLACALYVTTVRSSDADRWPLLEALAAGYRRALALDPTEIAAIPELMRRRSAFGLIHWIGRQLQGIASPNEAIERIDRAAMLARFLHEHADRVAAVAAGAARPGGMRGDGAVRTRRVTRRR